MMRHLRALAAAGALLGALVGAEPAWAQKHGGVLKLYTLDSPASMSILEETTVFAQRAIMGVFNNLVMFRPARQTEQPAVDRARPGHRLVICC